MSSLILYDGECGLCNRLVRNLLRIDEHALFRFASLQGETAAAVLSRRFPEGGVPDSVILVEGLDTPDERIFTGSDVVIEIGGILNGMYRALLLVKLIPRPLRELIYRLVARTRRTLFGTVNHCPFIAGCPDRFLP